MPRPTEVAIPSRHPQARSGNPAHDPSRSVAILGAFSFFLSAVEYTFPKPLPFMRLGIANLPLLLAVDLLPLPSYFLLAFVKFAGMGLVSGTLLSYIAIFSLAGSLASAIAMRGTRFILRSGVSHLGISVAGAMASAASQVLMARWLVFGEAAWAIAPLFLGASLVTGSLLGFFANRFVADSRWYSGAIPATPAEERGARERSPKEPADAGGDDPGNAGGRGLAGFAVTTRETRLRKSRFRSFNWDENIPPGRLALAGLLVALALLFQPLLAYKALLVAGLALLLLVSGKRIKPLATLLVVVSIIAANLAIPVGRVLARLGPFAVTETALLEGVGKALVFEGLIFVSRLALRPGLVFPGAIGGAVSEAFAAWQRIMEMGPRFRLASFVRDADALLWRLESDEMTHDATRSPRASDSSPRSRLSSFGARDIALAVGVAAALALLVAGRLATR